MNNHYQNFLLTHNNELSFITIMGGIHYNKMVCVRQEVPQLLLTDGVDGRGAARDTKARTTRNCCCCYCGEGGREGGSGAEWRGSGGRVVSRTAAGV